MQWLIVERKLVLEEVLHAPKLGRVSALERIDRLLFVTNDKDGARLFGLCALARCDLASELFDHCPLLWRCILRLINKDMINPAIEAIEHPFGDLWIG